VTIGDWYVVDATRRDGAGSVRGRCPSPTAAVTATGDPLTDSSAVVCPRHSDLTFVDEY